MMKKYSYVLQIDSKSIDLNLIDEILGIKSALNSKTWKFIVVQTEKDEYYDFINNFLDFLEGKYDLLAHLGVEKEDILFWLYLEYDQQCNMEFDAARLKRLGDNGIGLCITCWQK